MCVCAYVRVPDAQSVMCQSELRESVRLTAHGSLSGGATDLVGVM
jgi:hypothetical protein